MILSRSVSLTHLDYIFCHSSWQKQPNCPLGFLFFFLQNWLVFALVIIPSTMMLPPSCFTVGVFLLVMCCFFFCVKRILWHYCHNVHLWSHQSITRCSQRNFIPIARHMAPYGNAPIASYPRASGTRLDAHDSTHCLWCRNRNNKVVFRRSIFDV